MSAHAARWRGAPAGSASTSALAQPGRHARQVPQPRLPLPGRARARLRRAVWPFLVGGAITAAARPRARARRPTGEERVGAREGFLVVSLIWLLVAGVRRAPVPALRRPAARSARSTRTSRRCRASRRRAASVAHRHRRRSTTRSRCGGSSRSGSAGWASSCSRSPSCRASGSAGGSCFESELAGPGDRPAGGRRSAQTARRFVAALRRRSPRSRSSSLALLGWTGLDDRMSLYEAVAHAFATIATGGFSTAAAIGRGVRRRDTVGRSSSSWSLAGDELRADVPGVVRRRPARSRATRSSASTSSCSRRLGRALRRALDRGHRRRRGAVGDAVFQTVSIMTTTGFASADFNDGRR